MRVKSKVISINLKWWGIHPMTKTKIFTYDCFFNESIKIYVTTTFQLTRVRAKRQGAMIGYNFVVDFDETVHDVRPPAARDRDKNTDLA